MKHYYRIWDAVVQIMLLVVAAYAAAENTGWKMMYISIAGAWFIVSLIAHRIISSHHFKEVYNKYVFACIAIIALPLYGFIIPYILLAEIYLLPYLLPVMAVIYTCTCIAEIIHLRKRPLSYIK